MTFRFNLADKNRPRVGVYPVKADRVEFLKGRYHY